VKVWKVRSALGNWEALIEPEAWLRITDRRRETREK
jgi:hypothetical protein